MADKVYNLFARSNRETGLFDLYDGDCKIAEIGTFGNVIGESSLGNSIYADLNDFRKEHIGLAIKSREDNCNYGDYFTGMVKDAIAEARTAIKKTPPLPYIRNIPA